MPSHAAQFMRCSAPATVKHEQKTTHATHAKRPKLTTDCRLNEKAKQVNERFVYSALISMHHAQTTLTVEKIVVKNAASIRSAEGVSPKSNHPVHVPRIIRVSPLMRIRKKKTTPAEPDAQSSKASATDFQRQMSNYTQNSAGGAKSRIKSDQEEESKGAACLHSCWRQASRMWQSPVRANKFENHRHCPVWAREQDQVKRSPQTPSFPSRAHENRPP